MRSYLSKCIRHIMLCEAIQAPVVPFNGAMLDPAAAQAWISGVQRNGQSSAGGVNFQTSAAATLTLTSLGNLLQQLTQGGATTITIDSAYNIAATLPMPLAVGQTFTFTMQTTAGTTVATPTLLSTDVTLAGTTSMLASAVRYYQGAITQVSTSTMAAFTVGTTFTSLTQVGTSNLFTVALGTNTIVPVVGTLVYLSGITGTLPAGWYPIVKVTSATSFVIATPVGTVWTATAATVGSLAPSAPVYAPLITITGLYTIGANAAV